MLQSFPRFVSYLQTSAGQANRDPRQALLPFPREFIYFNPHFCILEMPTIFMGKQETLSIFQRTVELRLRFSYCGFNAARGIEECLQDHGIDWIEEESEK